MLEQSVPGGLYLAEGTPVGAVLEELPSVLRSHVGAVCEGLSTLGGTPHLSRQTV